MRPLLLVTTAIALFTIPANAADLPLRTPYTPVTSAGWSWTGFYVGVHGGLGGDSFKYPFSLPGVPTTGEASLTSSGLFGGGQVGFNYHFVPNWVVGIEADIAWSGIEGEIAASAAGAAFRAGTELDWFGTVRGRVGYAWDRTLLYVTGGWAYGRTTSSASVRTGGIGSLTVSEQIDKSGWAAGGGIEYALLPNLSVKTEYLYMDLGRGNLFTVPGTFIIDERTTVHTVKAGLNWKFSGLPWGR